MTFNEWYEEPGATKSTESRSPDDDKDGGVANWTPEVLTEYEIGRAVWAAEIIAKSDKPVTEVGCFVVSPEALEHDLRECVKRASEAADVKIWMRLSDGGRMRYGFYRDAWVVSALDFLDRVDLPYVDRAWINGLLFGYRTDAIQRFIQRLTTASPVAVRSRPSTPTDRGDLASAAPTAPTSERTDRDGS